MGRSLCQILADDARTLTLDERRALVNYIESTIDDELSSKDCKEQSWPLILPKRFPLKKILLAISIVITVILFVAQGLVALYFLLAWRPFGGH